jgi:hemerythrin
MTYFKWGADLSVGNSFIDHDHRRLIGYVNDLHSATTKGKGREVVESILVALIKYTQEHFQREEHHMERMHFAGIEAHKQQHRELLQQVLALQEKYKEGHITVAAQVSHLLRDWLSLHIMKSDKKLAAAIRKVEKAAESVQKKVPAQYRG